MCFALFTPNVIQKAIELVQDKRKRKNPYEVVSLGTRNLTLGRK